MSQFLTEAVKQVCWTLFIEFYRSVFILLCMVGKAIFCRFDLMHDPANQHPKN
jgi:hypothetical protein